MDRDTSPIAPFVETAAVDRSQARAEADTYCRRQLAELGTLAGRGLAAIREGHAARAAGMPDGSPPIELARDWLGQVDRVLDLARLIAVKGAILSGRWPEEREDEAQALCADESGLNAFMARMEKVPVGFVDQPTALPAQH